MIALDQLLVVAATARELAPPAGWRTLICGVGPVDAAAATAAEIARAKPSFILHVGIAGARRSAALAPAQLVIGRTSHYSDLGVPERFAPNTVATDEAFVAAAQRALPNAVVAAIATTAHVGGALNAAYTCDVEAMEGFAVLRASALAGVPAIEIRSISNDIEEADRSRWRFDDAFAAITDATPLLVRELIACVS